MGEMSKKYLTEAFSAVTALGTSYFYLILIITLILLGFKKIALHLAVGLVVLYSFVFFIRIFYFKERPNKEKYSNMLVRVISASSFPSLHTINSIFTASVLSQIVNKNMSIFFYTVALLIAYSRIHIKKHHLSDVIVGIIIGITASLIYLSIW